MQAIIQILDLCLLPSLGSDHRDTSVEGEGHLRLQVRVVVPAPEGLTIQSNPWGRVQQRGSDQGTSMAGSGTKTARHC